jgi:hypothetical protein
MAEKVYIVVGMVVEFDELPEPEAWQVVIRQAKASEPQAHGGEDRPLPGGVR